MRHENLKKCVNVTEQETACNCAHSPLPKFQGHVLCAFEDFKVLLQELNPGLSGHQVTRLHSFTSRTRVAPSMNWCLQQSTKELSACVHTMMKKTQPRFPAKMHVANLAGILSQMYLLIGVPWMCMQFLTVDDLDEGSAFLQGMAIGALDKNRGSAFVA